ncbi:hypothetical protein [Rathayibacter sp. VKM Ac-2754]|uniref:hypothetical protein n=1 Tax=Rathayibacter sp. VKM Ac-2754 TaxID=2609251 RepID=UPI001358124E|nr:hypothetical protein [Rathayibacter sp. VKM Ac-2754]MWV60790.1 hypothetical protein [Rathayibacter sp. VKM Ac-2754]
MTWDPTASRRKVALSIALASVGGVGLAVTAMLAALCVLASLAAVGLCAATYRGVFVEVYDEPIDCLAEPAWAFFCWFSMVGLGALASFGALLIGSGRPAVGLTVAAVIALATITAGALTSEPLAPWWPWV